MSRLPKVRDLRVAGSLTIPSHGSQRNAHDFLCHTGRTAGGVVEGCLFQASYLPPLGGTERAMPLRFTESIDFLITLHMNAVQP